MHGTFKKKDRLRLTLAWREKHPKWMLKSFNGTFVCYRVANSRIGEVHVRLDGTNTGDHSPSKEEDYELIPAGEDVKFVKGTKRTSGLPSK